MTLAEELLPLPSQQTERVENFLTQDLMFGGCADFWLPDAFARKYPHVPFEYGWHDLFPAVRLSLDPAGKPLRRHYWTENNLKRLTRKAASDTGIHRPVS